MTNSNSERRRWEARPKQKPQPLTLAETKVAIEACDSYISAGHINFRKHTAIIGMVETGQPGVAVYLMYGSKFETHGRNGELLELVFTGQQAKDRFHDGPNFSSVMCTALEIGGMEDDRSGPSFYIRRCPVEVKDALLKYKHITFGENS